MGSARGTFRVRANKFTQSMVRSCVAGFFLRLGTLGVDYYDRELPGQVAARCVSDLDRILQFFHFQRSCSSAPARCSLLGMVVIVGIAPARPVLPLIAALVALLTIVLQFPIATHAWVGPRRAPHGHGEV